MNHKNVEVATLFRLQIPLHQIQAVLAQWDIEKEVQMSDLSIQIEIDKFHGLRNFNDIEGTTIEILDNLMF